jgi:FlaA1/EpsC-like NDP-sugar epimerase
MPGSLLVRRLVVVSAHLLLWVGAYLAAFLARFEGEIPGWVRPNLLRALPILLAIRLVTFWQAGLFHGILRYAGMTDLRALLRVTTLGSLLFGVIALLLPARLGLPRSVYFLEWVLALATAGGLRFMARTFNDARVAPPGTDAPPAILLGAGDAGDLFLRDLLRSRTPALRVVGVLDDDPAKFGMLLHNIPVRGPISAEELGKLARTTGAQRAVLAMPTAPGLRTREIVDLCRQHQLVLKTLPSLQQIAHGTVTVSALRDVNIEDLLRRDTVRLDENQIRVALTGRRVLVTGAAGSIGSELVRQIAHYQPQEIFLLDHNENGLFFLERDLREQLPSLRFRITIGDIKDRTRIDQVFRLARPDVVFHAAAHKHVPLMEGNPTEAVRNNVLGTRNVAEAARKHGAGAFVLISTDKAVNPTSVMGASKRIAEMFVQSLNGQGGTTRFVAVRFGNVLGSAGSVVPIFRAQIERGGPVRVTDPEVRRYFMTIPEAAQLVLQASALAAGGEIFILDMGELVKIVDLARDMISLSGLQPDVDIAIEFTGARPGEKLYEELMLDREATSETPHPKIRVARVHADSWEATSAVVERLAALVEHSNDPQTVRRALADAVPEATLSGLPPASTTPRLEALAVR